MNDDRETRVTSMRDPALPSGGIIISEQEMTKPLPTAESGSRYFSGNINGRWYVLNGHMEKALEKPFDTEQDAIAKAAEKNGQEAPDIQSSR